MWCLRIISHLIHWFYLVLQPNQGVSIWSVLPNYMFILGLLLFVWLTFHVDVCLVPLAHAFGFPLDVFSWALNSIYVTHWWVYLFKFIPGPELVQKSRIVLWLRGYISVCHIWESILLLKKHFVFHSLNPLGFSVITVKISRISEF